MFSNDYVFDTLFINANITWFDPVRFKTNIENYPNPGKDYLYIQTDDIHEKCSLKIINSLSKVVYQASMNQSLYTIELKSWSAAGTYFVQLFDTMGKLVEVKKIILQYCNYQNQLLSSGIAIK